MRHEDGRTERRRHHGAEVVLAAPLEGRQRWGERCGSGVGAPR